MSDEKPDLTTTEVRQANRRKMNLRVLTVSIIVVAVGLALAVWYNTAVSPETDVAPQAGDTLEDVAPEDGAPEPALENLPAPVDPEPEPVPMQPMQDMAPPAPEAPADAAPDAPAEAGPADPAPADPEAAPPAP